MSYQPLPPHVDLATLDHEVIERWRAERIFARSVEASAERPLWMFYEGPPTANGMPGTHHVEARVFKDVFPRFKTMKGYHVPRMAGWDCHGLPVELAVEKGASVLLMPVSARKQLFDLSDDMATKVSVLYFTDALEAFIKALSD